VSASSAYVDGGRVSRRGAGNRGGCLAHVYTLEGTMILSIAKFVVLCICLLSGASPQFWGTYDGHKGCWAAVADTSVIVCADGFVETS
jgi:hypothetical protein